MGRSFRKITSLGECVIFCFCDLGWACLPLLVMGLGSQFLDVYYLSTSKVVNVGLYKIRLEDSYLSVFTHLTLKL